MDVYEGHFLETQKMKQNKEILSFEITYIL